MKKIFIVVIAVFVFFDIYLQGRLLLNIIESPVRTLVRLALFCLAPFVLIGLLMLLIQAMKALGLSRVLCAFGMHSWKNLLRPDVCKVCGRQAT